jgi:ADP-ribose pyrophosphatase
MYQLQGESHMNNPKNEPAENDDRLYPEHPIVAASAVIIREGKILLIKRGHEPNKGRWSIPGGRIELGETVYEAAQREVFEECNIKVEILRFLFVGDNIIRDNAGKVKYHYVLIDLLAEYKSGEIVAQSDATEYRWVTPEELPGLDMTPQLRTLLMQTMSH